MYQLILLVHVFAAVCLIALVLVQQGKGATLGAAFGSGASQTVFGSRGSGSFLFKITGGFLIIFFATSLVLNNMAVRAYKQEKVMTLPFGGKSVPSTEVPAKRTPEVPTRK
ncbi:MAG: preprotein translocase subunit SecG [Gammaproteobacteria bacterium]|nr:preprotein translocase subunit SecG [Gammaproteobacteria bacterium]